MSANIFKFLHAIFVSDVHGPSKSSNMPLKSEETDHFDSQIEMQMRKFYLFIRLAKALTAPLAFRGSPDNPTLEALRTALPIT